MKAVYKELNVDDKFFPVKSAINQMSRWKDQLISPEEALKTPARDTKGALAAKVYAAYERKLKEAGAFDFDDLIYQTVILLSEHEDVREFYQNKYKYLLVDEYQDTSVAQFRLVSLLTGPEKNICVVGDDDQSIYRFRGATIENILNFERIYKGTKTIRLEQNYRSTSNILNAANCVIQHNTERKGKTLWTKNGEGDKVQVYTAENEQDEAMHIADVIGQHLKAGGHLADHAILYRMNAQSAPIESYSPAPASRTRSWAASASTTARRSRTSTPICPSWPTPGTTSASAASSTSLRVKSAQRLSRSLPTSRPSRA
jgi:pcrA: ATP-dependent DNA helicase PcrA